MYVESVELSNIKSIASASFAFDTKAGWHIFLGDNGSGKSSLLRAIAMALVGPQDLIALRLSHADWVRSGEDTASASLSIMQGNQDKRSGSGRMLKSAFDATIELRLQDQEKKFRKQSKSD